MICPKCNKNNAETAKFCVGCGTKLEAVVVPQPQQKDEKQNSCSKCQKPLKQDAKFCPYCGTKVEMVQEQENVLPRPVEEEDPTVLLHAEPHIETDSRDEEATVLLKEDTSGAVSRPEQTSFEPVQRQEKPKKEGAAIVILLAVAAALMVAAIVVFVIFFIPGIKEKIPFLNTAVETQTEEEEETEDQDEEEQEETEGEEAVEEIPQEEIDALLEKIEKGKKAYKDEKYAEEDGCKIILEEVVLGCTELADQYGVNDDLNDAAEEALEIYVDAVLAQVDILFDQDVRPELYEQMKSDVNSGLEQADKLLVAGFEVEKDKLEEKLEELETSYTDRYIERFNAFTELETWSRTESWDLMSDADSIGLVDYGNMDDPMTQRYAYALARVTVKNVENGINDGSMSAEDAVDEIESVLADTDYNLFLMGQLAAYLEKAGDREKADEIIGFQEEIVNQIYDTQGILVGEDIAYDFFWSFNEFEEDYSVSDENGLTQSNHEWIRDFMKDKL